MWPWELTIYSLYGHLLEMWKTDGTDNGTSMVADINPGIIPLNRLQISEPMTEPTENYGSMMELRQVWLLISILEVLEVEEAVFGSWNTMVNSISRPMTEPTE